VKDPKIVDWAKVLVDAYRLGCRDVQFIGGEPTYNTSLVQYISTARKLGYTFIEVFTNLTLISEALANQFRKHEINIATSFYSPSKEVHDAVTGVKGSFDRTVGGIRRVLDMKIPLRVGIISMGTNQNGTRDCIEFLTGMGVDRNKIGVDHTRPVGRGGSLVKLERVEETVCGQCWKGKLAVSWDGACYPCIFSREVMLGRFTGSNLGEILHSAQLKQFRKKIFDHSAAVASATAAQDLFAELLAIFSGPTTPNSMQA
jgi:MoaA/NifB/PqqE/SkfB family radical SAM enzyme